MTTRRRPAWGRVAAIAVGWMAAWWLIVAALVAPLLPHGGVVMFGVAVASIVPVLVMVRGMTSGGYPSALTRLLVIRPFWYVQLALPLLGAAGALGFLLGAPFGAGAVTGRWALAATALLLALAAVIGWIGSRRLRTRRLEAVFPDLPRELDGLRIVQVSDLHVGPHTSRRHLARVAREVQAGRPDLIAITGDQVDDYARDVAHFAEAFGGLTAPLGVFAIAGNHDVYAGWSSVRRGLESMGVTVLVNEAVELVRGGARFWLAGTGDPAGSVRSRDGGASAAPDVPRTLERVPHGVFTVALAHNPVLWPQLVARGVHLTLSGHTHYGQLAIPQLGWSVASPFLEHAMGAHRLDGSLLYINPGTNFWGLPFRIGARPEVTIVTLRAHSGGDPEIRAA